MTSKANNSKTHKAKRVIDKGIEATTKGANKARSTAARAQAAARTTKRMGDKALKNVKETISSQITPEQIQDLLGTCYDKALNGVPGVSQPLEEYVENYTKRYETPEKAAQELIKNQLIK